MEIDSPCKLVAHVRGQLGQRRVAAEELLEIRCAQRTKPPRLELQFGPQAIYRSRVVNTDAVAQAHLACVALLFQFDLAFSTGHFLDVTWNRVTRQARAKLF